MTKLAEFEQEEGKADVKLSKYYKGDYVRYNVLKSVLGMSIGYIIILIMAALYKAEYLVKEAVTLDYTVIGRTVLGIYIMLLVIYIAASVIGYSFKYDHSRRRLTQHVKRLRRLRKFYKDEAEQK